MKTAIGHVDRFDEAARMMSSREVESRASIGSLAPGATRPFIRAAKEAVIRVGTVGSE